MIMQAIRGLVTAFRTLTILPLPGRDTDRFSTALYWFPAAGLFIGSVQVCCAFAVAMSGWHELAGLAMIISGVMLTRGLHADGLADLADGFWGGKTKESTLRIMKDPNVGSFGALALILLMLVKWVAVLKLVELQAYAPLVSGVLLARWSQVMLASTMPYARSEGGTAQTFVTGAGVPHLLVTTIASISMLWLILYAKPELIVVALSAALASTVCTGYLSYRKIGGVTGDVLGAASEFCEASVWISCALFCL